MIRKLVDFALNNRFVVITTAILVLIAGVLAFHDMPVEAYPDIADNYVNIITQWPGRSAEEVEQQVSIPIEIQMGGLSHLSTMRSESIFGLSLMTLVFDDTSNNDWNRAESARKAHSSQRASGRSATDRNGLEPDRPDLLVHDSKHESELRPDGTKIHRRLGPSISNSRRFLMLST